MRFLLAAVLAATACAAAPKVAVEAPREVPAAPAPAVPQQVQASEEEIDPCEERGRYGDGICDEMCPEVDPDCDPRVALMSLRP